MDSDQLEAIRRGMSQPFPFVERTDVEVEVGLTDDEVERIRAEADEHGRARWGLETALTDAHGTVVARTTNHYQLRAHGT